MSSKKCYTDLIFIFQPENRKLMLKKIKIIREGRKFIGNLSFNFPFYRIYPYKGKSYIRDIDQRGLVDFELGIFFNRIRKSANSTVVINLADLKYGRQIPSLKAKKYFMRPSQISFEQMNDFEKLFKFTIVRNPYTRTLSAYLDKIVRRKAVIPSFNYKSDRIPSFLDFCKYLEHEGLYENSHWAPQTDVLLLPIVSFDYIGKLESLDEDLRWIFNHIAPQRNLHPLRSHIPHQTNANKKLSQYYDDHSRQIVASLYKDDFDIFGYSVELK